ncbi:YfcC family protein [Candidatus Saccharibacteria bacterium]|nr:YfcC family protein [Candidatus Saccharibacteria bacterium]
MFRKKNRSKKRTRAMLSAYSIIMILIIALGILSHVLPKAKFQAAVPGEEPAAVEVGPGEWEGEAPAGGPKLTEGTEPVALPEGEAPAGENAASVAPAGETPAPREGEATPIEPRNEAIAINETTTDGAVTTSETVVAGETTTGEMATGETTTGETATTDAAEPVTYDTREACEAENEECVIVDGSGVEGAALWQILISPILGFENAIDVCIFVMILGGFLAIVAKTKALETGIKLLVKKLHGKEYILILLLMLIFSIFGTTYGFLEESVGFYVLIAATMFAAGMDPLVGVATILLGAGSGVLGSTINPFATGVAISAMKDAGIEYNQGMVILIAVVLWLTTLAISAFFTVKYAKKVQRDKGSTFLSLREQAAAEKKYGKYMETQEEDVRLTGKQIATLVIFAITFVVMIVGFIPWGEFGVTFFDSWTGWLTGAALGNWWFYEAALWFLLMSILIAIVNRQGEHGFVDAFIDGADDMVGVVLVIAVARGASVLMSQTSLDNYIVVNAANALAALPEMAFVPLNYILHIILSVLVPSSSGLATLSTPIIAPVASTLGYSTNVAAMTIVAANGLVNLITPTCGAIMGGLALAKVDYSTWFKWGIRVVACIAVVNIVVLCLFSL